MNKDVVKITKLILRMSKLYPNLRFNQILTSFGIFRYEIKLDKTNRTMLIRDDYYRLDSDILEKITAEPIYRLLIKKLPNLKNRSNKSSSKRRPR